MPILNYTTEITANKTVADDRWAVLELFGHTHLAGRVTEASIGGGSFIRVDVPSCQDGETTWTRYYGPSAIYSIYEIRQIAAPKAETERKQDGDDGDDWED